MVLAKVFLFGVNSTLNLYEFHTIFTEYTLFYNIPKTAKKFFFTKRECWRLRSHHADKTYSMNYEQCSIPLRIWVLRVTYRQTDLFNIYQKKKKKDKHNLFIYSQIFYMGQRWKYITSKIKVNTVLTDFFGLIL